MATVEQTSVEATPRLGRKRQPPRKVLGRLGPWQLLRTLGEGSMTRVYLARPADAEHAAASYAVKSLKKDWWSEPAAIEMQRREAWVGQRVSCPHLAPVLSAGISAPPYYTVTPKLDGQTAAELLASGQKPALPVALWIARQAAQALASLQKSVGMIHSDVKPANLMVTPDGHTTLLDLGFCQSPEETASWSDRPVLGTLRYMAPERFTSATLIDTRSDLYSLGATLYELIAGRPPHAGDTPAALVQQHRVERPECIRSAAPDTPKAVASLVHRLMAKDPMRRPATPREVADELAPLEIACFGMR